MSQPPRRTRKPPKFSAFLVTGGVVGVVAGVLVSALSHPDSRYDTSAALGFLGLIFGTLGVLAGGIVAVLIDKRS